MAAPSTTSFSPQEILNLIFTATGNQYNVSTNDAQLNPSALCVTGTAAAGTGVTVTLPAVTNNNHYITAIQIVQFAAALLSAAATPTIVTTTNLPGTPAFSFDAGAQLQGTTVTQTIFPTTPIKSTTANTNTTIVAPATTNVIWRINVWYYSNNI